MRPTAVNVNFDSLNEAFGFPPGFRDPSFFAGFDRLADLAARHGMPLSVFVIGRDLDNPEIAARVRDWHQQGHEIGNHTWSHPFNLGALSPAQLDQEIDRAHFRIAEVTGVEPKGFIAPNWCTSPRVAERLIRLGYLYDTSVFPSVMMWALVAKATLNHLGNPAKALKLVDRRDWLLQPTRPRQPYLADARYRPVTRPGTDSIVVLPLPAPSRLGLPLWHTVGLLLGWKRYRDRVTRALNEMPGFYTLMHPADFLGAGDVDEVHRHALERMELPIEDKMGMIADLFALITASGRPVVTMAHMAEDFLAAHGGKDGPLR